MRLRSTPSTSDHSLRAARWKRRRSFSCGWRTGSKSNIAGTVSLHAALSCGHESERARRGCHEIPSNTPAGSLTDTRLCVADVGVHRTDREPYRSGSSPDRQIQSDWRTTASSTHTYPNWSASAPACDRNSHVGVDSWSRCSCFGRRNCPIESRPAENGTSDSGRPRLRGAVMRALHSMCRDCLLGQHTKCDPNRPCSCICRDIGPKTDAPKNFYKSERIERMMKLSETIRRIRSNPKPGGQQPCS